MRPVNFRLLISTLLAYVIHHTDGCGRSPARTKTTPSPPSGSTTTTTQPPDSGHIGNTHRLVCTQDEVGEAKCLHGGECFALFLGGKRSVHCHCSEKWTGTRCQEIDEGFFVVPANMVVTAGIATGVTAVVIVVTIIIVYLVIKKRNQRRARRAQREASGNGHAGKALISEKEKEYNMNELDELQKCTDV